MLMPLWDDAKASITLEDVMAQHTWITRELGKNPASSPTGNNLSLMLGNINKLIETY